MARAKKATEEVKAPTFTKAALMASNRYAESVDLLGALLQDDKVYTIEEVDGLIRTYLEGSIE